MAKLTKLQQSALDALPAVVTATEGGSFVYMSAFDAAYLVEQGLAEQNETITNPADASELATRATEAGINFAVQTPEVQKPKGEVKMSAEVKTEIVIETGVEMPKSNRGATAGNTKYPFDKLEAGQSFFIAKELKSLGGTVSSANKRYAVEVVGETRVNRKGVSVPKTEQTRKFEARAVEGGTRIWRTK